VKSPIFTKEPSSKQTGLFKQLISMKKSISLFATLLFFISKISAQNVPLDSILRVKDLFLPTSKALSQK